MAVTYRQELKTDSDRIQKKIGKVDRSIPHLPIVDLGTRLMMSARSCIDANAYHCGAYVRRKQSRICADPVRALVREKEPNHTKLWKRSDKKTGTASRHYVYNYEKLTSKTRRPAHFLRESPCAACTRSFHHGGSLYCYTWPMHPYIYNISDPLSGSSLIHVAVTALYVFPAKKYPQLLIFFLFIDNS